MMTIILIAITICICLSSKYLIMIFMTPIVKYWEYKEEYWYKKSVSRISQAESATKEMATNSRSKKDIKNNTIKYFLTKLFSGYTRYYIIQVGYIPSHTLRNIIYKHVLRVKSDNTSVIYYGAEIRAPYNLHIGKGTIIGDKSLLDARNGIYIGDNVNFSSMCQIYTQQHDHRAHDFGCSTGIHSKVVIEDRAWIGPNIIILPGVHIGEGAVVGAGAVVTKDIAPFTINAGIPAKVVGERTKDIDYVFSGNHSMFY